MLVPSSRKTRSRRKSRSTARSAELATDQLRLENEKAKNEQDFELAKSTAEATSKTAAAQLAMMQQMMTNTAAMMQQMITTQAANQAKWQAGPQTNNQVESRSVTQLRQDTSQTLSGKNRVRVMGCTTGYNRCPCYV